MGRRGERYLGALEVQSSRNSWRPGRCWWNKAPWSAAARHGPGHALGICGPVSRLDVLSGIATTKTYVSEQYRNRSSAGTNCFSQIILTESCVSTQDLTTLAIPYASRGMAPPKGSFGMQERCARGPCHDMAPLHRPTPQCSRWRLHINSLAYQVTMQANQRGNPGRGVGGEVLGNVIPKKAAAWQPTACCWEGGGGKVGQCKRKLTSTVGSFPSPRQTIGPLPILSRGLWGSCPASGRRPVKRAGGSWGSGGQRATCAWTNGPWQ